MKKTLIALALAATGVSSGAYAAAQNLTWTPGEINRPNAFSLGGTFYSANHFNGEWQWAVGGNLSGFNNKLSDISDTNGVYTMPVAVAADAPILLGMTKKAFGSPLASGVGAIPQISFKGANSQSAHLTPSATPGQGTITIPLMQNGSTGATATQLGTAKFTVKYAGVSLDGIFTSATGPVTVQSLYSAGATSGIFFGGLPAAQNEVLASSSAAQNLIAKFSGPAQSDLVSQITTALTGLTNPTVSNTTTAVQENTQHNGTTEVFAAAYALGIEKGQNIELTFTSKPTATTEWKAPLQIEVSYN
ncbi:hypothetical protein I6G97_11520 [Edwardsiella hoshinae]|uniref:K88 pilin n=1 Tax=Edwardsiella hoshinae TaxID=93378 RepID=A0A376DGS8_9GAMM|nr:hypothetical protein [Edwardsiella hoshinae]QPR27071.1 hypothetical protein I6G97_11520 [Edwardsiella hoshinae]STC88562.1 K88 pilin [Edwardsiella hoshinae]